MIVVESFRNMIVIQCIFRIFAVCCALFILISFDSESENSEKKAKLEKKRKKNIQNKWNQTNFQCTEQTNLDAVQIIINLLNIYMETSSKYSDELFAAFLWFVLVHLFYIPDHLYFFPLPFFSIYYFYRCYSQL